MTSDLHDFEAAPSPKSQADERCADEATSKRPGRELPGVLLLSSPREDSHHQVNNVCAGDDVEDLEDSVPPIIPWRHPEEIKVASAEDEDIEELGEERHPFGALVAMDCVHQNAFRRGVGEISQDAEDVHAGGASMNGCDTTLDNGEDVIEVGKAGASWRMTRRSPSLTRSLL